MQESTMNTFDVATALVEVVKKLKFEKVDLSGEEVQEDVFAFYKERVDLLHSDGVDDAIFIYLKKLTKDTTVNLYTKLLIEKYAMEVLDS